MTIKEAIKNSGTTNILAVSSTKKAEKMLHNDEEVLYAVNTNVLVEDSRKTVIQSGHNGLFSLTNAINGVIAVTNERIFFCNSVLGNFNEKQILIKDIKSIDENINNLTRMGQIRVQGITEAFTINVYKKGISEGIKNSIHEAQKLIKSKNEVNFNTVSSADEIMKFKKMMDEGIITEEEFEKKKNELLN